MRSPALRSAFPALLRVLVLATTASAVACTGDEFTASPGGNAGAGGSGGGAAGSAGIGGAGTGGGAGSVAAGAGGAAGLSSGGAAGQVAAGSGGTTAGGGGSAAGSAGAGGAQPDIGMFELRMFAQKDCTGVSYRNDDGGVSVPQGGGEACVQLIGDFFESDVVKIGGDVLKTKLGTGLLSSTWTIPHGGGTGNRIADVEIIRGNTSVKRSLDITPRTVTATGSDKEGAGTPQRPWKTIQKALAGAKDDAIVVSGIIDAGLADPDLAVYDVPALASITALAGGATLTPLAPFALHKGAKIAGVTIDCAQVAGPCVQPVEGESTVQDVVLTAKDTAYAVLEAGVTLSVVGGKVTSPSAFLHEGVGSKLRLARVKVNHAATNGACKEGLRVVATNGLAAPLLDLDATGEPTTFEGYDTCAGVFVQGDVVGNLQNIKVSGSGGGDGTPAIVVRPGAKGATLKNVTVEKAIGIGLGIGGGNAKLEAVRVNGAGTTCLAFSEGTFDTADISASDCGFRGIDIGQGTKVVAAGKVDLSWASLNSVGSANGAALHVAGTFEQVKGAAPAVLTIKDAPFTAIFLAGKATFLGTKEQPDGLQIQGARGTSIRFGAGFTLSLDFGKIDSVAPTSELFVLDARVGAGTAKIEGTQFVVGGRTKGVADAPFAPPAGEYSNKGPKSTRSHVVVALSPSSQMVHTLEVPPMPDVSDNVSFTVVGQ